MHVRKLILLFFALLVSLLAAVRPVASQQADDDSPGVKVALIEFGDSKSPMEIGAYSESYLDRKLAAAQQLGADVVVLQIDSPGGLVDQGMRMAKALQQVDWAKTVAYVPRQALSAGSFLCLACDEILVADNGFLGDAGPIYMDQFFMFQHAEEKVRSDLAAKIRKLAEDGNRPPALAEAMVDRELVVFKVTHADDGRVSYMSDAELEALDDPTEWTKGASVQESKKGNFLQVNGARAAELGLADAVVNSRAELAERYELSVDDLLILNATWVDTLIIVLNYQSVTILLFILGLIAAYVELAAPGISVGGLVAALCFGIFFWSRFLGGTAGWLEVLLFLSGVCFLGMELFVIPGFGVAGLGGILLMITSLVMASQRWGGSQGVALNDVLASLLTICVAGVGSILGMWFASRYVGELRFFRRLTLEPPTATAASSTLTAEAKTNETPTVAIGDEGVADSMLRPAGRAMFGNRYFDVVTDGSFVAAGSRVRIIKLSGTHITVRQIEDVSEPGSVDGNEQVS